MLSPQAQKVKDWLTAYREEEIKLDNQYERLRRLESRMMSAKIMEISDMPKAFGNATDGMSEYVIKKERLLLIINRLTAEHNKDRANIEKMINELPKAVQQSVIELRYIDGLEWLEVAASLSGADDVKIDSTMRRAYRAHEEALEYLGKHWTSRQSLG